MQRPVRQTRHAAAARDELDHHCGQFRRSHPQRFDAGRIEERREDVEPRPIDRVADQHFVAQVFRLDPLLLRKRVRRRNRQLRFVGEQREVRDVEFAHRIGGDHKVEITAPQRRQRREVETARDIQFDVGPTLAVPLIAGKQPLEAAVALDRHVQTTGLSAGQAFQVALRTVHHRQHLVGEAQHAFAGRGESQRSCFAHEQRQPRRSSRSFNWCDNADCVRKRARRPRPGCPYRASAASVRR